MKSIKVLYNLGSCSLGFQESSWRHYSFDVTLHAPSSFVSAKLIIISHSVKLLPAAYFSSYHSGCARGGRARRTLGP